MLQSNLNRKNMFFFTYIAIKTSLTILFFKDNITVKMLPELRPNSEFYFGDIRIRVSNERNVSHKNAKNTKIFVRISQTFWMNFRKDLAFFLNSEFFSRNFRGTFACFAKKVKLHFRKRTKCEKMRKFLRKYFFRETIFFFARTPDQNSILEISEFHLGDIRVLFWRDRNCPWTSCFLLY